MDSVWRLPSVVILLLEAPTVAIFTADRAHTFIRIEMAVIYMTTSTELFVTKVRIVGFLFRTWTDPPKLLGFMKNFLHSIQEVFGMNLADAVSTRSKRGMQEESHFTLGNITALFFELWPIGVVLVSITPAARASAGSPRFGFS
jgi:hypothetical protein